MYFVSKGTCPPIRVSLCLLVLLLFVLGSIPVETGVLAGNVFVSIAGRENAFCFSDQRVSASLPKNLLIAGKTDWIR